MAVPGAKASESPATAPKTQGQAVFIRKWRADKLSEELGHALPFARLDARRNVRRELLPAGLERRKRAIETALTELRQVYSSHYRQALHRGEFKDA